MSLRMLAAGAAALFVFRRYAPFPALRLCVSAVILLHAIEAVDVARNERASPRLRMANAIRAKKIASPLQAQYFSMAPYAFGKRAVKWSARPCGGWRRTAGPAEFPIRPRPDRKCSRSERKAAFCRRSSPRVT